MSMEFNLADLFESVADAAATEEALVSGHRRLTYDALDRRANRLAHHLAASGVRPGDPIGVQLTNSSEYLETMLACFKIRAVPVNINYRYVARELEYLYRNAGLVGLVFHSRFGPAVTASLGAMSERRALLEVADGTIPTGAADDYEEILASSLEHRGFPVRRPDDRYCVYTGGSTGMPKGVLWRHDDIFFAAMGGGDPLSLGDQITRPEELAGRILHPGMVALAIPPFMHAAGHWLAFSTFFGGGTVVTTADGGFDPTAVWQLVEAERVNTLVVVGDAMARPLLEVLAAAPGRYDLSSLIAVGSGGALLSPTTKAQLAELLPGRIVADRFGSSETGQVGGESPDTDPFGPPRLRLDDKTAVFDERMEPIRPGSGAIGHLARSGHVPLGYLGDPSASAGTFVESGGRRWALPGDLATVAVDGTITVLGRGSLCINTGGEKVFPDEVEAVVKDHVDVADAIVVGVADERFGERVVAIVQARPGRVIDSESLRLHCHERLTGFKVPKEFLVVDRIERSPSGKPDYPQARTLAEAGTNRTGN